MGGFDSSKTRVSPVFDTLFERDSTGATWLRPLLMLGSRVQHASHTFEELCLIEGHGRRWGDNEASLPAPRSLLEYLVQNLDPMLVKMSRDTGNTHDLREKLCLKDPETIAKALEHIRAGKKGRKWFVLEGESRPDALLETSSTVICIEGKRTEAACTTHTNWMQRRSQLIRHMDSAMDLYPTKSILGMLIVEGPEGEGGITPSEHWREQCRAQYEQSMLDDSLPHRDSKQREIIGNGVIGVTTWQAVCKVLDIAWESLPDAI